MNLFDIIGPVMIGPSSSHTAGAVRIGGVARRILGEAAAKADIALAGSFALTGRGHGTDKALVAGILGMAPDDGRIRDSLSLAREAGLSFVFREVKLPRAHPNTALVRLTSASGAECAVQGASVGGGAIEISRLNGMDTVFTGERDTFIIPHRDAPGTIAAVTSLFGEGGVNIGNFRLSRPEKGYRAVMTIEVDGVPDGDIAARLKALPNVIDVVHLPAN